MPHSYNNPASLARIAQRQQYMANVPGVGWVPGIQQGRDASCGLEAVGLVNRLLRGEVHGRLSYDQLVSISNSAGGRGFSPEGHEVRGGVHLGPVIGELQANNRQRGTEAPKQWGTDLSHLVSMLGELGVTASVKENTDIRTVLQQATFQTPFIVRVDWGRSAHFVVCCGYTRFRFIKDKYCFTDPYYGVLDLKLPPRNSGGSVQPTYVVPVSRSLGATSEVRGFITDYYVKVG